MENWDIVLDNNARVLFETAKSCSEGLAIIRATDTNCEGAINSSNSWLRVMATRYPSWMSRGLMLTINEALLKSVKREKESSERRCFGGDPNSASSCSPELMTGENNQKNQIYYP